MVYDKGWFLINLRFSIFHSSMISHKAQDDIVDSRKGLKVAQEDPVTTLINARMLSHVW